MTKTNNSPYRLQNLGKRTLTSLRQVLNLLYKAEQHTVIFFALQDVKVSALALLKMVMHARSGGNIEVMGLLLGKVDANVMVVFQKAAYSIYV